MIKIQIYRKKKRNSSLREQWVEGKGMGVYGEMVSHSNWFA